MPRKKKAVTKKPAKKRPTKARSERKLNYGPSSGVVSSQPLIYAVNRQGHSFEVKTIRHQSNGDGIRISGRSVIANITKLLNGSNALTPLVVTPPVYTSAIAIHPRCLFSSNTRSDLMAKGYERWCFRSLVVRYVPNVSTTETGQVVMIYNQDPTMGDLPISGAWVYCMDNPTSVRFQPWAAATMSVTNQLNQEFLGYMDIDASPNTSVNMRQQIQGCIYAVWTAQQTSTGVMGTLELDYELDLFNPMGAFNVVLLQEEAAKRLKREAELQQKDDEVVLVKSELKGKR